jgi:hypothetical protein
MSRLSAIEMGLRGSVALPGKGKRQNVEGKRLALPAAEI